MASDPEPQVELREGLSGGVVVVLTGALDVHTTAAVRRELTTRLAGSAPPSLEVDASGVERGDVSGMALLYELTHGRFGHGVGKATVTGLRPELERLLRAFPPETALVDPRKRLKPRSVPQEVGAATITLWADVVESVGFLGRVTEALRDVVRRPRWLRLAELTRVFEKAGANALPIVSLISLLTGLIIAFETAQPLKAFGAQIYIANMIGLVMVRELGPIMTAIVFAGRSGSAFAAELGTMKVNEELDALTTMGLDPTRFLVIQRVLAGTMAMPLLTAYSMAMGILGGVIVTRLLGFPLQLIWKQLSGALGLSDIVFGLVKAVVFGAVVSGMGCYHGIQTRQGPSAVGDSATRAVVAGILMIILIDAVFSVFGYVLHV